MSHNIIHGLYVFMMVFMLYKIGNNGRCTYVRVPWFELMIFKKKNESKNE